MLKKFESPQEEALEIALETRKKLINSQLDLLSALRSCLVIASILNKVEFKQWVEDELFGYCYEDKIPGYRKISCEKRKGGYSKGFGICKVCKPASFLLLESKSDIGVKFVEDDDDVEFTVMPAHFNMIVSAIVDKCLIYLNNTITELQYGSIVENLMEEIRKNTDEKLANLDKRIVDETKSLFLNLTSNNPADWSKVGHSSRRMLMLLADVLFPPQTQMYTLNDKRKLKVDNEKYFNRLSAFIDQKLSGSQRRLVISEIEYFEYYLREVIENTQKCEHNKSIEKHHANMVAIHTYLIISELLRLQT